MAAEPRVSVIIPTYNRERLLGEAIASVLRQSFRDFELLIVDDGSTDATRALVARVGDPRIRYLHQTHRGISAAMNTGIRAARGIYVARLDSDDRWEPDMLATLVPVLDERPEIGVAYGRGQAMDASGRLLTHTQGMPPRFEGDALRSLIYDDCTCNVALVARRTCLEEAGLYDEALAASEDWDMWLRVARRHQFAFVDRVLAHIRWHPDNLTGVESPQFAAVLEGRTAPLDKLFRDPDLPARIREMRPIAYTNVYLYRGLRWLQVGRRSRALGEFKRALAVSNRKLATAVRIGWFAVVVPVLRRSAAGRRLLTALADSRRRRINAAAIPSASGPPPESV